MGLGFVSLRCCLGSLLRVFSAVAFSLQFDDMGVMNESIDGRHRHALVGKDAVPLTEWLIGCDDQAGTLIAVCDQLKQHAGLLLIPAHIANVIN